MSYNSGHPWYYKLDGKILKPKEISFLAILNGYQGYLKEDILQADRKTEPQRSEKLRTFKTDVLNVLWPLISSYRKYAHQLRKHQKENPPKRDNISCDEIHQSMSLTHNHIYNHMAHLNLLDTLLSKQADLFG